MTHLTITDIIHKNDEPRIEDLRLATLLGFGKTYNLRKLIRRHEKELEKFGKLVFSTVEKTAVTKGGRRGRGYWLNEKQALYICTKSEAPNAIDITIDMVEVFHAFKTGQIESYNPKALSKNNEAWRDMVCEALTLNNIAQKQISELLNRGGSLNYYQNLFHETRVLLSSINDKLDNAHKTHHYISLNVA